MLKPDVFTSHKTVMSEMKETLIKTEIRLPERETPANSCHSILNEWSPTMSHSVTRERIAGRALARLTRAEHDWPQTAAAPACAASLQEDVGSPVAFVFLGAFMSPKAQVVPGYVCDTGIS